MEVGAKRIKLRYSLQNLEGKSSHFSKTLNTIYPRNHDMDFQNITERVNELVDSFMHIIRNLPQTIINMPLDEQSAWGAIAIGVVFVVLGIFLL